MNSNKKLKSTMEMNSRALLKVLSLIPSEEFIKYMDELDYLIKLIKTEDKELENIVIGVYDDKNSLNEKVPMDIVIITAVKTYIFNLDYEDPITKEIMTKISLKETGWKRLNAFKNINKREIILKRLITSSAIYYEQVTDTETNSKYEFMEIFKNIPAITQNELVKQIKAEGKSNEDGSEIELDITDDMNTLSIMKLIYNKLKNDSLNVYLLGVSNDITYVGFESDNFKIKFEIGFMKKTVTMLKKKSMKK